MDWTICQATTDAAPVVREIARESWHAAYDEILGADTVTDVTDEWYAIEELEESIADARTADDERFLVAASAPNDASECETADEIAGFAHAGILPDDPAVAFLARLYVRPDAWGEGAGTALLERLESTVESRCDRLRLTVLADNEIGVSFYESAGFERVRTRRSDLGDGVDECIYEKEL